MYGLRGRKCFHPMPTSLNMIVAPHHGGDMGPKSMLPKKVGVYERVIYSFVPGNKRGT